MGKTETKLFKLAQQRENYHENVPKKKIKMRQYYQKNTIAIKQNPEAQSKFNAKRAADRQVSEAESEQGLLKLRVVLFL